MAPGMDCCAGGEGPAESGEAEDGVRSCGGPAMRGRRGMPPFGPGGGPPWMRRGGRAPEGPGEVPARRGEGQERRDNVISVRVTSEALLAIDMLVHGGVARSRSEAAALLIEAGVRSNRTLFQKISTLRQELSELHTLAADLAREAGSRGDERPAPEAPQGADAGERDGAGEAPEQTSPGS